MSVTLPATYSIEANDSLELVVEMPEAVEIESSYYNVSEKSITFYYADDNESSSQITATY